MARKDRSYIGKGPLYIKKKADDGGFFPIGNASQMDVSFDEESKSLKNYTQPGGGNINTLTAISAFTGTITMHDYSAANMALALRGTVEHITAGAVTEEPHSTNGTDGEFIPFNHVCDPAENITVVTTADGALAEGTDYSVEYNGIIIIGTGSIDATGIKISYTKAVSEVMEALTSAAEEYELYFNAVNEAQGGDYAPLRMHRIKFSPAQGLSFLGDEFGGMTIDFEALADPSITGTGLSKYMKHQQAVPA